MTFVSALIGLALLLTATVAVGVFLQWRQNRPRRHISHEVVEPLRLGAESLGEVATLLQFSTELFMARHYGLAMVSFTPVILLIGQLAAPADPGVLIAERAVETGVGAAVGILVVVLIRRRRVAIP